MPQYNLLLSNITILIRKGLVLLNILSIVSVNTSLCLVLHILCPEYFREINFCFKSNMDRARSQVRKGEKQQSFSFD